MASGNTGSALSFFYGNISAAAHGARSRHDMHLHDHAFYLGWISTLSVLLGVVVCGNVQKKSEKIDWSVKNVSRYKQELAAPASESNGTARPQLIGVQTNQLLENENRTASRSERVVKGYEVYEEVEDVTPPPLPRVLIWSIFTTVSPDLLQQIDKSHEKQDNATEIEGKAKRFKGSVKAVLFEDE